MLDEYLAFARGEGGEESETDRPGGLVRDTVAAAAKARPHGRAMSTVDGARGSDAERQAGGAAALPHQSDGQCPQAWPQGGGALARDERFAEIAVEDDGPGIPEGRREEAFRPFHRLDEGRNLQTGGSGLGLAIARDIARAHGGDVVLGDSALGGLKAAIRLPV